MFTFAEKELMILSKTDPYSAILPFAQEILDLCKKVENSGQSKISIHFISELLANTIKKLLLKTPISPVKLLDIFEKLLLAQGYSRRNFLEAVIQKSNDYGENFPACVWSHNFERMHGILGTPTSLKDDHGNDLFVGDQVIIQSAEGILKLSLVLNKPDKNEFYIYNQGLDISKLIKVKPFDNIINGEILIVFDVEFVFFSIL